MMKTSCVFIENEYNTRLREYRDRLGNKVNPLPWKGIGVSGKMSGTNIMHVVRGLLFRNVYPFSECNKIVVLDSPSFYPTDPKYDFRRWITEKYYPLLNIISGDEQKKLTKIIKEAVEETLKKANPEEVVKDLKESGLISERAYKKRKEDGNLDKIVENLPPEAITSEVWDNLEKKLSSNISSFPGLDGVIYVFIGDERLEEFLERRGYSLYRGGYPREPKALVVHPKEIMNTYGLTKLEVGQITVGAIGKITLKQNNMENYLRKSIMLLPTNVRENVLVSGLFAEDYNMHLGVPGHPLENTKSRIGYIEGLRCINSLVDELYLEPTTSMYAYKDNK